MGPNLKKKHPPSHILTSFAFFKLPTAEYTKCNEVAKYIIQYWNHTRARSTAENKTVSAGSTSHTIHGLKPYTKYVVAILVLDTKGNITNKPDEQSKRTATGRKLYKQIRNSDRYTCIFDMIKY